MAWTGDDGTGHCMCGALTVPEQQEQKLLRFVTFNTLAAPLERPENIAEATRGFDLVGLIGTQRRVTAEREAVRRDRRWLEATTTEQQVSMGRIAAGRAVEFRLHSEFVQTYYHPKLESARGYPMYNAHSEQTSRLKRPKLPPGQCWC